MTDDSAVPAVPLPPLLLPLPLPLPVLLSEVVPPPVVSLPSLPALPLAPPALLKLLLDLPLLP